jgi:hypothetical protein
MSTEVCSYSLATEPKLEQEPEQFLSFGEEQDGESSSNIAALKRKLSNGNAMQDTESGHVDKAMRTSLDLTVQEETDGNEVHSQEVDNENENPNQSQSSISSSGTNICRVNDREFTNCTFVGYTHSGSVIQARLKAIFGKDLVDKVMMIFQAEKITMMAMDAVSQAFLYLGDVPKSLFGAYHCQQPCSLMLNLEQFINRLAVLDTADKNDILILVARSDEVELFVEPLVTPSSSSTAIINDNSNAMMMDPQASSSSVSNNGSHPSTTTHQNSSTTATLTGICSHFVLKCDDADDSFGGNLPEIDWLYSLPINLPWLEKSVKLLEKIDTNPTAKIRFSTTPTSLRLSVINEGKEAGNIQVGKPSVDAVVQVRDYTLKWLQWAIKACGKKADNVVLTMSEGPLMLKVEFENQSGSNTILLAPGQASAE